MQQPSPNISGMSSPSSFLSPRASPLLGTPAEQIDPFSNINIPVYESQPHQQQQPQQTHQIQPLPDGCDTDHKNIASNGEDAAPPKQVALAMERLAQMGRLIADYRLCADRIVETILKTVHFRNADPNSQKYVPILRSEGELMFKYLEELRSLGRTLESSGVLIGALQKLQETPGWGLHMPLVCPDGAVVAYAWKRQLAGQAAASAVDRTRLALKAFTDQKRRFFPHLEDNTYGKDSSADLHVTKKPCLSFARFQGQLQDPLPKPDEHADLLNVLKTLEAEASNMKIIAYPRFEWFEKASLPHAASWKNTARLSKQEPSSSEDSVSSDMLGVLDILVPCAFRAVVSVTPAGSTSPDAVAVFSAEEAGTHIHARGSSVYSAFREISKYADKALQYFLHTPSYSPLDSFLRWLYTYQSLFTKSCSKCGQVLAMHTPLGMLLPPVIRPYRRFEMQKTTLTQPSANMKQQNIEEGLAFHMGCILEDEL